MLTTHCHFDNYEYMPSSPAAADLIFSLLRTNTGLELIVGLIAAPLGLSANEWRTIRVIGAAGDGLTVPHVAGKLGFTRQGVQRLSATLKERGFIRFEDNEFHAKSRRAVLTAPGREAFRQGIANELAVAHRFMADFGDDEIRVATRLTEKLMKRFKMEHAELVVPSE
jgi:DNA-binding MarR family transcriptional regulator